MIFTNVYNACETSGFEKFYRFDGYLFKENCLCTPLSSIHKFLIWEVHGDELLGYFGVIMTLNVLQEHFY